MLGFVADHWAELLEDYRAESPFASRNLASATKNGDNSVGTDSRLPPWKYPTLSMNLELKKILLPTGVKWLFLRAQVKMIEKGRLNAEIVILDEGLDIVAFSHQISYVVPGLGFTKKINKL